jgi:polar amino acid transport system substrate-binding protein
MKKYRRLSANRRILLSLCAAICGGSQALAQEVYPEARASLPETVRQAGVLKVAASMTWPPYISLDSSGEPEGIDVDVAKLLAAKLGLKPEFTNIKFPTILPSIQTGRFDLAVGQIGLSPERVAVMGFVPYEISGLSLLVRKTDSNIDVNDLCGHELAVTTGSWQVAIVEDLSTKCVSASKKAIATDIYPDTPSSYMAVANGRGEGFLVGRAVGMHLAKGVDQLKMAPGDLMDSKAVSGLMLKKENQELRAALAKALESALDDGSYQSIFDKYSVPESMLTLDQMRMSSAELLLLK